jgi:hypothetical protein
MRKMGEMGEIKKVFCVCPIPNAQSPLLFYVFCYNFVK